jgi:DNA-binding response OmpR family regulator
VKVETDFESGKKDVSRPKSSKGPIRRALVVEDDPVMAVLIQEVLGSVEIEVVTPAKSIGNEFHFPEQKFDVVLIGLCTSPEDDIELIREFRRSGFNQLTPIILISADQRPIALSRGLEAGATFFVYKPIDRARLTSLIRATEGTIERERRRFRRVPIQVKVRLKSAKSEVVGETIDISLNGALVRSSQTLPVGSLIEVSLYIRDGSRPVVGLGSVVRLLDNSRMGILLDRFPMAEIGRLQEYLLPRILD